MFSLNQYTQHQQANDSQAVRFSYFPSSSLVNDQYLSVQFLCKHNCLRFTCIQLCFEILDLIAIRNIFYGNPSSLYYLLVLFFVID